MKQTFKLLLFTLALQLWPTTGYCLKDRDEFTALVPLNGNDNVNMRFQVISETNKTAIVGSGYSCCIDTSTVGNLIIPPIVNGYSIIAINDGAFSQCSLLETIEIPKTIDNIGGSAFKNCKSLTNFEIPSEVTIIGSNCFKGCSNLISVNIPDDSKLLKIGSNSFQSCEQLLSINIPKSVTYIGSSAFEGCKQLISVSFSEDGSLLELDGYAFAFCEQLKSIYIPKRIIKIYDGVFEGCSNLETLSFHEDCELKLSHNVLKNCTMLKSLIIPKGVIVYNSAFISGDVRKCIPSISSIVLMDGTTTIQAQAFQYFENLSEIKLPNSLKVIGAQAFYNCRNLKSIEIPDSVTKINSMTFAYTGLKHIKIPDAVTSIESMAFTNCFSLDSIEISPYSKLTEIKDNAFYSEMNKFRHIILPKNLKSIGTRAFFSKKINRLETITSFIEEPFPIDSTVFMSGGRDIYEEVTLYVPTSDTKRLYRRTEGWKNFKNIESLLFFYYVYQTKLTRDSKQIHINVLFSDDPDDYSSLDEHVSLASKDETLKLLSFVKSGQSYDLYFELPKKKGTYTLRVSNTFMGVGNHELDQNGNGITGEDDDNYTENFVFGENELYIVAQSPTTGVKGKAGFIDVVLNDVVGDIPISQFSLVSPSGKETAITKVDYLDNLLPCRHRVYYDILEEDGIYTFTIHKGLKSSKGWDMLYDYQAEIDVPYTNLKPMIVTPIDSNWVVGQQASVSYQVSNISEMSAIGKTVDVLYLSPIDTWSHEAIEIYRDTVDVNLQSKESYTHTIDVTVPPCVEGQYYLILKTNVAHTINELSFDDNMLESEALNVTIEWLSENNNKFSLNRGESRLFKIPVGNTEKNVEMIVDEYGIVDLYLGYYFHPSIYGQPKKGCVTIISPDSSMVCYLLVTNNKKNSDSVQPCELSIRYFDMEVASVGREKIVKYKTAWIPIEVKGCTEMPVFYLMDPQGKKTMNKDVYVMTETLFYAQFDTETLQTGKYNLYVECNGKTGMMQNAVTITNELAQPSIDAKLVLPGTSRFGETITAYIDYKNTGNVDIPAPLFILTGTEGSKYILDGHSNVAEEAHIMGVNEKGVLGTLLLGESNRITVKIEIPNTLINSANFNFNFNYNLKTITEGCEGIDEPFYLQWLDVDPNEKPSCYTDEEWKEYHTRLRKNVGDTWQTFIQALGKAANMYFTADFVEHDAHFLYSILKEVDLNALDSDIASNQVNKKRASNKDDGDEPGMIYLYDGGKWLPLVEAVHNSTNGTNEQYKWIQTEHCSKLNSTNYFFISHGMDNNHHEEWIRIMAKTLNDHCNGQILCVCWGKLSSGIFKGILPWQAASHINEVVRHTHNALNVAFNGNPEQDISLNNFHFIGHSHGSHVCGRLANSYSIGPKRLTALDESEEFDHWYKEYYNRGGRYNAKSIDYYKSSVICGTEWLIGDDNFILARGDGQFTMLGNDVERHGYATTWFTETINENKGIGFYWDRSKHEKIRIYGRIGNSKPKGWSGVINGPKKIIEDYTKYFENKVDWNYLTPWYTPKNNQKKPSEWEFQKALASTIEYDTIYINPYHGGNDYIKTGTTEFVNVSYNNTADNHTIPLCLRLNEIQGNVANALFITNSNNSKVYSIQKNKDGISEVRTQAPLYILGYDINYGDISKDGLRETGANISFTITTELWDRLAGTEKDKDYIFCDLWFVLGCDKWATVGYASSNYTLSKMSPFNNIKLWKGELYPDNNVIRKEKVKVKNPTLACNAGNDMTYTLGKGQKTVNVNVNGVVERDNGMGLSYNWEKGNSVFSNSKNGNIPLGVGSHTLTFHIKAQNGNNAKVAFAPTTSANEASDDVIITVKPYIPGDEDDESTWSGGSFDPNEKVGIRGAGGKSCVRQGETMEYVIYFENDAEKAQLAAQTVTVIDTLDTAFDLSTFEFTGSEVANTYIDIPSGKAETTVYTDLRPANDLILKTDMMMDIDNRVLTVVYSSLDTLTYEPTQDVFAGFLPPNDSTHIGEGHFSYRVKLKDDVADGYEVRNQAHIFFDYNDEIATNTTSHIVDNRVPISYVEGLPPITMEDSVLVSWSGIDEGAGVKYYDIYRSKNGGEFELWLSHVLDNSAIQYGKVGDVYSYYSIATDSLGFVEAMKTNPEATVKFTNPDGITLIEKCQVTIEYDNGAFTITGAEGGTCDVYDLAGQLMANKKRLARQERIAFHRKGVYVVNVETLDGDMYAKKMVVK